VFKTNTAMPLLAKPIRWPNPLKAWRERQEARETVAYNRARMGTALDALCYAQDELDHITDREHFLNDWRVGDLEEWPNYRPKPKPPATLSPIGGLVRAAALLSGFMGGLLFLGGLFDAALSPTPGDPLKNLLTLAWAAALVLCAGVAWRAALQRGEG